MKPNLSFNSQKQPIRGKKLYLIAFALLLISVTGVLVYKRTNNLALQEEQITLTTSERVGYHVYDIFDSGSASDFSQISTSSIDQNKLNEIYNKLNQESIQKTSYSVNDTGYAETEKRYLTDITIYFENNTYRVVTLSLTGDTDTMLIDGIAVSEAAPIPEASEDS